MSNKTPLTQDEMREKLWGVLPSYSHSPELCSANQPCSLCKRSISAIMQLNNEQVALALEKTEKAYGGCHMCFGKGYATVNDRWAGTDEFTGKRYETGSRNAMKFCTCERGKQLIAQLKQRKEQI